MESSIEHAFINNLDGCDLLLSLFISALQTYRVDNCLRPFPKRYYTEAGEKNIEKLRQICDKIPQLKDIKDFNTLPNEVIYLLRWLIIDNQKILRLSDLNTLPATINITIKPHNVFSVLYNSQYEDAWQKRKGDRTSFYAFHGSKLENFYSIYKVGLQQHFSIGKNVLFGQGIYLTTEMSLSALYAPYGLSWKNSKFGSKASIIALCEVIDDVSKVKYYDPNNKSRAKNDESYGNITQKYFVVTDSDMVRVKYLLLYKTQNVNNNTTSWIYKNFFAITIFLYVLMLLGIGFFSSKAYDNLKYVLYENIFGRNYLFYVYFILILS